MRRPRGPQCALATAAAGLGLFLWGVLSYRPVLAFCAPLALVPSLWLRSAGPGRRWAAGILSLLCGAILWAAFGTATGYFWLNRTRLEALIIEIEAVPAIRSLQMGHEDSFRSGAGPVVRYDSYRFINEQLVTRHREQVAPEAFQPTLREIDVLRELDVPPERYAALRAALHRLSLAGFHRGEHGEILLDEPMPGGTPWATSFLYRPADGPPSEPRAQVQRRLAPRWFHVRVG